MNHERIGSENLLDLYLLGRLDATTEEQLEEHFVGCDQCTGELELRRAFVGGVQQLPAEEFGLKRDFPGWRRLALAASVLLAITGPLSIWSMHELSEARRAQDGSTLAAASFVVMPLVSTRSSSAEAPNVVELDSRPQWLVFEIEGDYLPGQSYALRLSADGAQPLLRNSVVADNRGMLVAGIPSGILDAGRYTIDIAAPGRRQGARQFQLQVVREKSGSDSQ